MLRTGTGDRRNTRQCPIARMHCASPQRGDRVRTEFPHLRHRGFRCGLPAVVLYADARALFRELEDRCVADAPAASREQGDAAIEATHEAPTCSPCNKSSAT